MSGAPVETQLLSTVPVISQSSNLSLWIYASTEPSFIHRYEYITINIAYLVIGANGSVRGKKVTSLARWPPNPSRCWALTWRTIGPMEDYWARSGGLLAEWPLSTSGGVFPLTRLTTDA